MLNLDKTKIVKVYPSQKAAGIDRKLKSGASISKAIRKGTKCQGNYFKMWFDCDENMKQDYTENNKLPIPTKSVNSKKVKRIDNNGNSIIYPSIKEIEKQYGVGRATIYKAIEYDLSLRGFKWEFVKSTNK